MMMKKHLLDDAGTSDTLARLKRLPVVLRDVIIDEWYALFECARLRDFYQAKMVSRYTPRASRVLLETPCSKCIFSPVTLNCVKCGRMPEGGHAGLLVKLLLPRKDKK